jgi:hypothetical protein
MNVDKNMDMNMDIDIDMHMHISNSCSAVHFRQSNAMPAIDTVQRRSVSIKYYQPRTWRREVDCKNRQKLMAVFCAFGGFLGKSTGCLSVCTVSYSLGFGLDTCTHTKAEWNREKEKDKMWGGGGGELNMGRRFIGLITGPAACCSCSTL